MHWSLHFHYNSISNLLLVISCTRLLAWFSGAVALHGWRTFYRWWGKSWICAVFVDYPEGCDFSGAGWWRYYYEDSDVWDVHHLSGDIHSEPRGLRCLWTWVNRKLSPYAMSICSDGSTAGAARRNWLVFLLENIFLSETWLNKSVLDFMIYIEVYNVFKSDHTKKRWWNCNLSLS